MNTTIRVVMVAIVLILTGPSHSQDETRTGGPYGGVGAAFEVDRSMAFRDRQGMEPYYEAMGRDRTRILRARPEVLLIPSDRVELETLGALREDLKIMSHILDARVQSHTGAAPYNKLLAGFDDFFERHRQKTEVIYVEGYGVLFLRNVDFPLSPPPEAAQDGVDADQAEADETWERARQEILFPGRRRVQAKPAPAYDAERLEALKTELVRALKHADNIRHVRPQEWIIVTLSSGTLELGTRQVRQMRSGFNMEGGGVSLGGSIGVGGGVAGGFYGDSEPESASVMCLRVKQGDIGAFARREIDLDAFRAKVQILMY